MNISLKSGERVYINSAILRTDRKVNLELLNDATFLLEAHVMQEAAARTPVMQLYFVVQTMMIDLNAAPAARRLFDTMIVNMLDVYRAGSVRSGLQLCHEKVVTGRHFDALKALRDVFAAEQEILGPAWNRKEGSR